jgi:hypothetical protein
VEELGKPQDTREKGRGLWHEVERGGPRRGAVRFMFNIDAGLMLGFELEVGFEAESDCEKRAMVSCESVGNLLFWV